MSKHLVFNLLLGIAGLAIAAGPALAQVRGSLIPPETLEVTLQRSDRMFERLDVDRDGSITQAEISAMGQRIPGQGGQQAGGAGRGGGRGAGMMLQMFATADSDGDSQISREEMRASATERFREQDRNSDGVVSADERPAFPGRPGAGFGPPPSGDEMPPMGDMSGD